MTNAEDLLEVIVVGLIAGVGLATAFALAIRAIVEAGDARRAGTTGRFVQHTVLATVFVLVCVGAVAFAIYSMINH